ncbi:MAG: lipoyl(octanoyl) transferase LipB [Chryseolinea sp.]
MNTRLNKKTQFVNLGLIGYQDAWEYQTRLFEKILSVKTSNRDLEPNDKKITGNYLIFCEHPHVFTLGKSGKESNLLLNKNGLPSLQASYFHINRGGDITYHGPGQIVGYPIFDLENFFTDIHQYLRLLEEVIIQTLVVFDIPAGRIKGLTGVWVDSESERSARKICAFGVRASRWVTMHGFALNVNTDLNYFDHIVPCGIKDKSVTSLQKELGHQVDMARVQLILKEKMTNLFELEIEGLQTGTDEMILP